jgi:heat shock protein HtpX
MKTTNVLAILAPIGIVVAVLFTLLLAVAGLALPLAAALGVAAGAGAMTWLYRRSERAVASGLHLEVVGRDRQPRLHNMVDGLCDSHGFRRPALAVIHDPGRNALVFGRSPHRATLAVSTGLLDSLTRMELEGLLARELALANHAGVPAATVLVSVLSLLPAGLRSSLRPRLFVAHRVVLDDFGAVRLTRYPPGLAAALDKLSQGSTVIAGANGNSRHLWVADPSAEGPEGADLPTIDERVAALREL